MLPILIVAALVSLLSVNVFISRSKNRRRKALPVPAIDPSTMRVTTRVWEEVADRRGLLLDQQGSLGFRGDLSGVPVEVELADRAEIISTVVKAHRIPEISAALWVTPRSLGEAARAALRGGTLASGDTDFDTAFLMGPKDAKPLASEDRDVLFLLVPRKPRLTFDGSTVELVLDGAELVHEHLEAALDLVVRIAKRPD